MGTTMGFGNIVKKLVRQDGILSLDSQRLIAFLSRPRSIVEIAQHFGVALSQAESSVMEAVESGKVLVSSGPQTSETKRRAFPSTLANSGERRESFPKLRTSKVNSRISLSERGQSSFKLRGAMSTNIHKTPASLSASELLGRNDENTLKSRRGSLPLEFGLLETLETGPKQVMELKECLGVSRGTLKSFVRQGFLEAAWGPKGIGFFFRITPKGADELKRLRAVSNIDAMDVKKKLVSLKRFVPQYAG